jgi:DNA-binding transcriptional ArsR family regulator
MEFRNQLYAMAKEKTIAISHPFRQKLLKAIHEKKSISITDLYRLLDIGQTVCSMQLTILYKAGFVAKKRAGKKMMYSVDYESIEDFNQALEQI